jgi:hypothetical protein
MTKAERDSNIQAMLGRYGQQVGRVIVGDDTCLVRLLGSLRLDLADSEDREVAHHLGSYLVA